MRQAGQTRQTRYDTTIGYYTTRYACCQKCRVFLLKREERWKGVGADGAERLSCF